MLELDWCGWGSIHFVVEIEMFLYFAGADTSVFFLSFMQLVLYLRVLLSCTKFEIFSVMVYLIWNQRNKMLFEWNYERSIVIVESSFIVASRLPTVSNANSSLCDTNFKWNYKKIHDPLLTLQLALNYFHFIWDVVAGTVASSSVQSRCTRCTCHSQQIQFNVFFFFSK